MKCVAYGADVHLVEGTISDASVEMYKLMG